MSHDRSTRFDRIHARSLSDPGGFWGEAAGEISWIKPWETVLDDTNPPFYRWFKGGMLNTCYNAVDRHVEAGHGARPAGVQGAADDRRRLDPHGPDPDARRPEAHGGVGDPQPGLVSAARASG